MATPSVNPAAAALRRFVTEDTTEDPIAIDPSAPQPASATPVGIGSAAASTVTTAGAIYPAIPLSLPSAPPLYPAVPVAHGAGETGAGDGTTVVAGKLYPDVKPSAPPAERVLFALADIPTIENPEVATSYLNAPLEILIPKYTKVRHGTTAVDVLLSKVKAEANAKGFKINPSMPVDAASTLGQLGLAIVDQSFLLDSAKPVEANLGMILSSMDRLIAQLHNKEIPADKRALIEIALRSFCTTRLYSRIAGELFSASATGTASFHPAILERIEDLNLFLTRHGAFKPVLDVKALVAEPVVAMFAKRISATSQIPGANAVERFEMEAQRLTRHLDSILSTCPDSRKFIFRDKLHTACMQRALPVLEQAIVAKAINFQAAPGALEVFAAELRSLKIMQSSYANRDVSFTRAIESYFDGLRDPAQKTLEKKLELFNLILSGITYRPLKALTAIELRNILHKMEMGRYEEAATRNQLPSTWVSELHQIADCLTRNGIYADAGEEPLDLTTFISSKRESMNVLDLVGGPLLDKLYTRILATAEASIAARSRRLVRELSVQEKVPLYLEQVMPAVDVVMASTEAPNALFAGAFIKRLLHKQFAEELAPAALRKAAAQRDAYLKTGLLPIEMYGDAIAVHKLETNDGRFVVVGQNALQRQISSIFGTQTEIESILSVISGMLSNPSNTIAQTALYAAQKQTLTWAQAMSEPGRTEFLPPPFIVPPSRPIVIATSAPTPAVASAVVTAAPIVTTTTTPAPVRPEWIVVRATESIVIDESNPDWFDALTVEQQLCILSNIVMNQHGPIEAKAITYLPAKERRDYIATAHINNARRDYDPITLAKSRLEKIERDLPAGDDLKTHAKTALIAYALRHRTFESKVTLDFLRDRGFGGDAAFLGHVYRQAVAEAQGFEISEGNTNWAGEHWYADTQVVTDPMGSLRATRRVAQALERLILS